MIGIVDRLRFDATRCEVQFSKGVAGNITEAADEIERLTPYVEAFRREEARADKLATEADELRDQLISARAQGAPSREAMAETIHKARWPADRQMDITPFADEDRNGREYCFRIADAVLTTLTSTYDHPIENKGDGAS